MATEELTPSAYIGHHLTFFEHPLGDGSFWTLNVDSIVTSLILGVLGMGFLWWVLRGATSGVPNKRQAFVEVLCQFVDDQAKDLFHGDRRFIAPLALTVGLWALLMNAMDFLPADITAAFYEHVLHLEHWRQVPTADVNTTFALSISVWLLMVFFGVSVKGVGGFLHEIFSAPFGLGPWWSAWFMWIPNFAFNIVEYISKPLSHSLRLYGNMYAGEIIFFLLWMLAGAGIGGAIGAVVLGLGWAIFHVLIVALQAYIFMMLTVVYIAMAHESH